MRNTGASVNLRFLIHLWAYEIDLLALFKRNASPGEGRRAIATLSRLGGVDKNDPATVCLFDMAEVYFLLPIPTRREKYARAGMYLCFMIQPKLEPA